MATETVKVLNTETGKTAVIPRWILNHPKFNTFLVEVDPAQKPFVPELYTPKTPEEFKARKGKKDNETNDEAAPEVALDSTKE